MVTEYVQDLEYTEHFYGDQGPYPINYIAALNGIRPRPLNNGFTYCELGCGKGLTSNVLAAANPEGRFVAIDFNRDHILHAQKVSERAGTTNITFLQRDFAQLMDDDLPPFDFITLHGVYSWIVPELRRAVVEFIDRKLVPGGLVYISYNALPGWAPLLPMREIMLTFAENRGVRTSYDRAREGGAYLKYLRERGAGYFTTNALATMALDKLLASDPRYVAHEYLNAAWTPMYFHQVASDLRPAGLEYVGSATVLSNYDPFIIPPAFAELMASSPDRETFETHKAFILNERFRKDVFVKVDPSARPVEAGWQLFDEMRFTSATERAGMGRQLKLPFGELRYDTSPVYEPLMDALCSDAYTVVELSTLPGLTHFDPALVAEAIQMLVLGNRVNATRSRRPAAPDPSKPRTLSHPLNEMLFTERVFEFPQPIFASPTLGSGLGLDLIASLALRAFLEGPRETAEERLVSILRSAPIPLVHAGKRLETEEQRRDAAHSLLEELTPAALEKLRLVGILA